MEKIRVLHVLQRMEPAGIQSFLMSIYRNIDREKIQFDFLVHYKTPQMFDDEIEKMGGKIYRLSVREDYNILKYKKELNNFFRIHSEYKIVHGHMNTLGYFYLSAAKRNNVPVRIAHSHTCGSTKKGLKLLAVKKMNKNYSKYATELFACSNLAGNYMFGNQKYLIINNGIDSKRFIFNKEKREKTRKALNLQDKFVIGSVGRFHYEKNQKFSIDVFEKIIVKQKNARLVFIGSGPMEQEIKEYVQKKKLEDYVLFLGNRNDMPDLYQAMDVFLFPSIFEGLGIVGVEAQAAGTPTVCSDTLPHEIDVSPLIYRLSLDDDIDKWVKCIFDTQNNKYIHKDMSDFIKKSNYDICSISKWLQDFYIEKYK